MNKIKLSGNGSCHNYTKIEQDLFALLSEKTRISSNDLAAKHFGKKTLFGRNNVVNRMKQLAEKVTENDEKFAIKYTEARGPKPLEFWIERKA